MRESIVLGTRGSLLAQTQTKLVARRLQERWPELHLDIKIIKTPGDEQMLATSHLAPEAGRKGVFTAAIEQALLAAEIDIAVHSAKDLPSDTSPDAPVAAVLPRESPQDILVGLKPQTLKSLPQPAWWGREAFAGNINCFGKDPISTLSIFAAMCQRGCENCRRVNGTRLFWRVQGWPGWVCCRRKSSLNLSDAVFTSNRWLPRFSSRRRPGSGCHANPRRGRFNAQNAG